MNDAERDPVFRKAVDDLRRLPPLDRPAVRRVVEAAAAARVAPAEPEVEVSAHRRPMRIWPLVSVAASAAFIGFALHGVWNSRVSVAKRYQGGQPAVEVGKLPSAAIHPVSNAGDASDALPIPHQFVFENANAHRVSVVGDFNAWSPASARMVRSPGGASWSVIVPVLPGRHFYGFMVDDSLFTLDPHQAVARNADLGGESSVIIVGRP